MIDRRVKLGLIGAGIAARKHHLPALDKLKDLFEVTAIASRTRASAEALAPSFGQPTVYDSAADLLAHADVDAVDLLLPTGKNLEIATAAAKAGKHILLEKPIATTLDEARQIIALEDQYSIRVLIGENWHYAPEFHKAKALIAQGVIGQPFMLHYVMVSAMQPNNHYANTAWRAHPQHPGGFISDGGVHNINAFRLLGGEISRVHALARQIQPFTGAEDTIVMNLEFANGLLGQFTLSYAAPERETQGMRIYGAKGTLATRPQQVRLWPYTGGEEIFDTPGSGFVGEFQNFYEVVVNGAMPEMTATEGFKDLAVIVAALKSARSGQVESVEQL